MSSLKLALSHAGPSTLRSLLSSTANRLSSDPLEIENDRLRTQLDLQLAIAAQYEEDLSARDRYAELLSIKLAQVEKTAERWRRKAEKDKMLLADVQDLLEQECDALEEELKAERAAAAANAQTYDDSVFTAEDVSADFRSMRSDSQVPTKDGSLHSSNIFAASHRSRPSSNQSAISMTSSTGRKDASYQTSVGRSVNMSVSRQDISEDHTNGQDYGSRSVQTSKVLSESSGKSLKASQQSSSPPVNTEQFQKQAQELETIARERDQLFSALEAEKQRSQRLSASLSAADNQLTISASAFATAKDTIKELQSKEREHFRARETAEHELGSVRQELEARVEALREESAELRSAHKLELDHLDSTHRAAVEQFASREESYLNQIEELHEQIEERDAEYAAAEDRVKFLTSEVEGLKRNVEALEYVKEQAERRGAVPDQTRSRIEELEKESERARRRVSELERGSGHREIEITRLKRKLEASEVDREGLNDALELKQQELEMLKRKFGVRGTAGMTPLPTRQDGGVPRTLSVPDSAASIASSSITESVVDSRAGPLLDRVNVLSRRSLSVSGMSAMKSTKHVRIAPRPSNPMEMLRNQNSSINSASHSTIEDSNFSEDTAATPRAAIRDKENRRSLLVPA